MSEIIVGKYHGCYLTAKSQEFVLLAAPTGAEKGVAVLLPNLLNFPDSVVVLDLKLENFRLTSRFRAMHGQQVYLWAPFAEDGRTHSWNMLDAISRNSLFRVGEVLAIAQTFYPSDCDPKEKFWNDNARNLFLGLVLYLLETPELPCTLGEVFRQSSGRGRPLKDYLQTAINARRAGGRPLSNDCLYALGRFLATPENTLGNIISTFNAPLLVFANPVVDAATSRSDFDLSMLRRRRISIYVGIQPNRLSDAALLINMFFTQVIDLNTKELPECNPGIRYECLIALDELIALGKIHILAKANPYIRGYGLRLLTLIQSVAQLSAVYGEADARTLITNHAVQIAYAPQEQRDAEDYSKMLGMATQVALSRSSNSPHSWGVAGSVSESRSDHGRALMLPQELKMMRKHQQIVFIKNTRPILCDKARYYEDHRFLDRLKAASPFLASLDATGVRQLLRIAGLHGLAKAVPSQQQIKHAAFVLQELSIDIPALNLATTMPASAFPQYGPPPPAPPPTEADVDYPGSDSLPRFADPECPSKEEATAIVHAFFEQLSAVRRAPHAEPNSIAADNGAAAPTSAARPIQPQDGSTVAEPAHPDLPPAAPSMLRPPQSGRTPIDLSVLDP